MSAAPETVLENWGQVAERVAKGNVTLMHKYLAADNAEHTNYFTEIAKMRGHIASGTMLMSGRHLQHGDASQSNRPMEVFTNCATAAASFLLSRLLLSGAGVGRCYDDDMMVVDWENMPNVHSVLDESHPDFRWGIDESVRDAEHKYGHGDKVVWHKVEDTREGWAKAMELLEVMAFQRCYRDHILVLDWSEVREAGAPIMGMQGRPSSGPIPMMSAIAKIATLKGAGMATGGDESDRMSKIRGSFHRVPRQRPWASLM